MKYTIHTPPYSHLHGGLRALRQLSVELQQRGCDAETVEGAPPSDGVHVYPEIVQGNPADADRVVRWLLAHRRYPPAATDAEVAWEQHLEPSLEVLQVPIIDHTVFYPSNRIRSGVAVWAGKGSGTVPDGAAVITTSWPAARTQLAELLRSVTHLVSFDALTAVNNEAVLCGCPVLVQADKPLLGGIMSTMGMTTDPLRLDCARREVVDAYDHYRAVSLPAMAATVDRFVDATQ